MPAEQPSELQIAFLQALWEIGEGTVVEVQACLEADGRPLATTTVATVLRRLESKGWVAHREDGRRFLYRAAVSRDHGTGRILDRITGSLFGGDVSALVSHLLDSRSLRAADLERIKEVIAAKEKKLK